MAAVSMNDPIILVMCTGNVCRSPMAEALMRHHLQRRGIHASVVSRGLGAPVGREPHPHALAAALHFGVPIDPGKRAQQVDPVDLRDATVVLVMDKSHRRLVQQRYPAAGGKTFLLGHWQNQLEIPDPIRDPAPVFLAQWPQIQDGCVAWIDHLLKAGMLRTNEPK